jgi:hypothetical protein
LRRVSWHGRHDHGCRAGEGASRHRDTARRALRVLEERLIVAADGTKGFMILIDRVPDDEMPGDGSGSVKEITQ